MLKPRTLTLKKGTPWPNGLSLALACVLSSEEIHSLQEQGVAIRLSFQTPYPRPKHEKKSVEIPDELLAELRSATSDPRKLESLIEELSGPQIIEIAHRHGIKLQEKQKLVALRGLLFNSLRSEEVWKGIAGMNDISRPPGDNANL